jgi:hypothetical protein
MNNPDMNEVVLLIVIYSYQFVLKIFKPTIISHACFFNACKDILYLKSYEHIVTYVDIYNVHFTH